MGVGNYIEQERLLLFEIKSPFVARIIRTFQTYEYIYIAQEFCPCGEFSDLVTGCILPADACRFYIANMVLGLKAAHEQMIVYRDFKPGTHRLS